MLVKIMGKVIILDLDIVRDAAEPEVARSIVPVEEIPLSTIILNVNTGCNLACKFCQNWDVSKSREMDKLANEASPGKLA